LTAAASRHPTAVLYDAHGAVLFACALQLLEDPDAAQRATLETIVNAGSRFDGKNLDRAELIQRLYRWYSAHDGGSSGSGGDRSGADERVALALCRYGRRDYRWVAQVMQLPPPTVASLLRSALFGRRWASRSR
jgi:hypothetical protein